MDSSIFTHNEFLRQQRSSLKSWQLGQNIEDFDASNEGESAPVITSTSTSCNRILGAFATFSKIPMLDHIPDAGALQMPDANKLTGFWLHLLEMQKTFVAINTELSWIPELLYAFDIQGKPFNLTILSEKHISIVNEVWPKNLFQVSYVGIQGHLSDPMGFSDKQAHPLEAIRLGQIHKNIEQAEPVLRNADLAFIDLNILKSSEIPGIENVGSSGLSSEQLSQLCRYLGFSEKLKAIAFYGIPETDHLSPQVADICAQALWYFYQGTTARRLDYPIRKEHLIEYLVESSNNNPTVKFFKSDLSDRWWFKIPGQLPRDFATHGLYPCSFEEYEQTCFGEIPDRLISAMHRYDQLRKE